MFLGGNAVGAAVGCACLVFSRHWRFWFGTIEMHTTYQRENFLFGLNSRPVQFLSFLGSCVQQGGYLSLRR